MEAVKTCKYLSDDFNEICVNANCPCRADFCPCTNYPEICKYSMKNRPFTNADRLRAMADEELADWLVLVEQSVLRIQPTLDRAALKADWRLWLNEEATWTE